MGVRHLAIRRRDFRPKQTFFFFATLAFFLDSDSFEVGPRIVSRAHLLYSII